MCKLLGPNYIRKRVWCFVAGPSTDEKDKIYSLILSIVLEELIIQYHK